MLNDIRASNSFICTSSLIKGKRFLTFIDKEKPVGSVLVTATAKDEDVEPLIQEAMTLLKRREIRSSVL